MAAAASSARCGGTGGRADAAEAYDVRAAFEAELLSPSAPCMNVLLFAVGSRGGVAPFVRIALELVAYGHRVRLATHGAFRGWVESEAEGAFEFFPLAGQPETLMNYMTAQEGRVFPKDWQELQDMLLSLPQNQEIIRQLVTSTLPAATAAAATPQRPSDSESDSDDATLPSSSSSAHEFLAEAIIANPLSFGAIHVAQGLGIPLHMVYPQPWVATKRWPHPLALHPLFDCDYVSCSKNPGWNEASYGVVNKVLWHSQSSAVNDFRSALGLSHITLGQRNDLLRDHQVPFSFLWPRAIIDKPVDWEDHIRVVGSVHPGSGVGRMTPINSGIKDAECQARLESFLAAPATPIFVGFGSCEPKAEELCRLVDMIVAAAEDADVRIVFQFNQLDMWDDRGGPLFPAASFGSVYRERLRRRFSEFTPEGRAVAIGDCDHAWLFPRVAAVVHHGGAGTVSAGLRVARPTMVIPFVGDQFFWGQACISKGVGPQPLAFRKLVDLSSVSAAQDFPNGENCDFQIPPDKSTVFRTLVERLAKLRQGSDTWVAYQARAEQISARMLSEDGAQGAMRWFHANLPSRALQCDLLPQLSARFFLKKSGLKVSVVALLVVLAEKRRKAGEMSGAAGSFVPAPVNTAAAAATDNTANTGERTDEADDVSPDELGATTRAMSADDNFSDDVEVFTPMDWGTQGPKDAKQGLLSALGRPVHNILNFVPRAAASVRDSLNESESVSDGLTRVAISTLSSTPSVVRGVAQTGLGMAYDIVRGAKAAGASTRAMQPHSGLGVSQYLDEVAVKGGGHGARGVSEVSARIHDASVARRRGSGASAEKAGSDMALSSCIDLDRLERQFQLRMGLSPMVWRRGSRSSIRRHAVVASSMVNDAIHSPRSSALKRSNKANPKERSNTSAGASDTFDFDASADKKEGNEIIPLQLVRIVLLRYEALTLASVGGETTGNWTALPPCPPPGFTLSRAAEIVVAKAKATHNSNRARSTRSGSTSSVTSTGSRSRSTSLDPVRDSVSVALSRAALPAPAPLPQPSQITSPTVRGWLYKLGTATDKSIFNMYKYTSYFWVRRFFTIRGGRLVYALTPSIGAMQSTAGPLPADWEQHNAQVRGSFNLAEIEIRAVSEPIDLFSGERFGRNIGKSKHSAGSKAMKNVELKQTGSSWGDAFVPGYPNAHHHCIELRAFGHQELGEVLVAPSPDIRDRWLEVLLLAQRADDYWRGVDEDMSKQAMTPETQENVNYSSAAARVVASATGSELERHGSGGTISDVPLAPIPSAPPAPALASQGASISFLMSATSETGDVKTKDMKAQKRELKKRRRALEKREKELAALSKQRADEHEAQVTKEQRLEDELIAAKRDLEELRAKKSQSSSEVTPEISKDKQVAYTKMLQERLKETEEKHEAQLREAQEAAALRESVAAAELVALKEEMQRLRGEKDFLSQHKFHVIEPTDVTLGRMSNATFKFKDVPFAAASKKQLKKCQVGSRSDWRCFEGTWNGRDVTVQRLSQGARWLVHEADAFAALGQGHANLITCYGFMQLEDGCEHLICELAELGTLSGVLNRYSRGQVARDVQLEILIQVCSGMECLQRLPLIHRDLAARNIMVAAFPIDDPSGSDAAQNVDVKVSDFGLSKYGGREREIPSTGETKCKDKEKIKDEEARPLRYMAPETFAVPPAFSEKSDVWAFGVLVWEVLDSCKTWAPYGDVTDDDALVTGVVSGTLKLSRPKKASKALWRIAQSCMQRDPEQRPRFVDLAKTLEGLRATIQ